MCQIGDTTRFILGDYTSTCMNRFPSPLMKSSFLNLFMNKLTRERVVPIISASVSSVSRDTLESTPWGWSWCSLNRLLRA